MAVFYFWRTEISSASEAKFYELIESMNSELKSANKYVKPLLAEQESQRYPLSAPFFQSPKLEPLSPNILIAACWQPGFAIVNNKWDLTINVNGNLRQRIGADTPNSKKTYTHWEERLNIGADEATRLIQLAIDLNFTAFQPILECITTDVGSYQLWFRLNGEMVTYVEDGCGELSAEHQKSFRRLWKEVHQHAPFPKQS